MTSTALRRAARGAAMPLVAAVAAQSVGNLAFHAVVGRLLPAGDYGALGAVLAAMVMLGVPLGALQAAASTLVAERGAAPGPAPPGLRSEATREGGATEGPGARASGASANIVSSTRVVRSVAGWSAGPAVAVLVAAPVVQGYFHLGSWLDAAQLAPYLVLAALLATARGLLLGARRLAPVAHTYLVGTVVRLALGLLLVGPFGVSGALVGTLAGEAAGLVVAVAALRRRADRAAGGRTGPTLRLRAVGRAAVAVTGLFLFSTVDLLLARHHLAGAESGAYVAAATVAKTVLALPAALMSAVLPRLVAAWPYAGRGRALAAGGAVVVAPALAGAAVVVVAPGWVLALLYGDRYATATTLTQLLATVAALTCVVSLMTHAALARRAVSLAIPWAGATLEVIAIEARHATAAEVATGSVLALVPTLLVITAVEVRAWRRPPPGKPLNPAPPRPIGDACESSC